VTPDWQALENLVKEAKLAYEAKQEVRLSAIAYMIKLMVEDLQDVNRSIQGCVIHPSGSEEIQVEVIRTDRGTDRKNRPARFWTSWFFAR